MRRIVYSTLLFLLLSLSAFAQNEGINFQGMARTAAGEPVANQKISLRLSVLLYSESGTVEYSETKESTTSGQGVFSVVIGDGSILTKTGNFSDINWKSKPKFLKVELDPIGGTNFALMGTSRLQAVPFAYYANGVDANNIQGTLPIAKGGTGVGSITALKTSLGIDQVTNTSDANKPLSTDAQAALGTKVDKVTGKELSSNDYSAAEKTKLAAITGTNTGDQDLSLYATTTSVLIKENQSNKSTDALLGGVNPSNILFPTQKAVKEYVAANATSGGVADGGITNIKLGDLSVTDSKILDVAASKITGTVGVANGGTGVTTLTGIVKANGTSPFTAATAGTDYLAPNGSAANLTSFPTLNQNTTGNAATATKLAASKTINGVAFDGSADITIATGASAETLTGTTLKSTVTGSSLTSVGTLGNLTVTNPIVGSITGNAATATKLAASKTINGVAFDGSADITIATGASAETLTGTTLKSTVTGSSLTSVGTLGNLTVTNPIVGSITGNAATATKLAASKNINGIAFDGSADINAPAKFTNDVTIKLSGSKSLGKYANGATIPTAGKTLDEFLLDLVTESIPPTYNEPSVTISDDKNASYEIGTNIGTVTLSSSFTQNNAGAATGTTYFKDDVSLGAGVSTNNHGVLSTSISYSVTVTYGAGTTVINNNLGTPDATGQIPAGSKSSSLTISTFANKYWGSSTSNSITDATLIAGTNENSGKAKSTFTVPITGESKYIFYAYPASLGALSSISVEGFGSLDTFTLTTRDVTNASGHSQSYNIYISNNNFASSVNNIIIN